MAKKVFVQIMGGELKSFDIADGATLGDVLALDAAYRGYAATVNGEPESDMSIQLESHAVVTLSEKVKGA
jgi:hypothetical protein